MATFLFETFCCHGWSEVIISDQVREFVNQVTAELCERTGIEHRISSPYHPQTNELVEQFKQTLMNGLKKVTDKQSDDWDDKIDSVLYISISNQVS